jgi:hypothetical protein
MMGSPAINIKWVLIPVFSTLTGYTEKAVRGKIEQGVWLEGVHYRHAPDGRIHMNLEEHEKWVEGAKGQASK